MLANREECYVLDDSSTLRHTQPTMPPDQPASTPNPTTPPTAAFLAHAIALRSMVPDPGSQGQRAARVRRRGRPKHQITPLARIMVQNAHTNPQLAQYLGCGLRTVEYWTTGDKPISNRYIERVCQLYRKPAEFFAYDRDGETVTLESRAIAEEFFSVEATPGYPDIEE